MKSQEKKWVTAPISPTCRVLVGMVGSTNHFCDEPTAIAYPAMGGGWMALCFKHGKKHLPYAKRTDDLIAAGEKWE